MTTNKDSGNRDSVKEESLRAAMDRRLSFLDERPSCRAALQYRIAQEEEPVMKKKMSLGLVFALALVLLSVAAVAATLLLSPRASAALTADQAMRDTRGITAEMMTFFGREEEELSDGAVRVTYKGVGSLEYVLGTYTALVRGGKAEITWTHDGEDTSGGYGAEAWDAEQLKQLLADSQQPETKQAALDRAWAVAEAHGVSEDDSPSEPAENYFETIEADKTAALKARKLSEEEMIAVGREFIISNYGLSEEQATRMELYTNSFVDADNCWYDMVDGKPCFQVEYLLYAPYTTEMMENGESPVRMEMDGFYVVYVNVETGAIEEYQYNSALAGEG